MEPHKARANAGKRGAIYDDGTVFFDNDALDNRDIQHSRSERRYIPTGKAIDGRMLIVAVLPEGAGAMQKRNRWLARGGRAAGSARHATRMIDFSDIPDSLPEQSRVMRQLDGPLGDKPGQLIAIRVKPERARAIAEGGTPPTR